MNKSLFPAIKLIYLFQTDDRLRFRCWYVNISFVSSAQIALDNDANANERKNCERKSHFFRMISRYLFSDVFFSRRKRWKKKLKYKNAKGKQIIALNTMINFKIDSIWWKMRQTNDNRAKREKSDFVRVWECTCTLKWMRNGSKMKRREREIENGNKNYQMKTNGNREQERKSRSATANEKWAWVFFFVFQYANRVQTNCTFICASYITIDEPETIGDFRVGTAITVRDVWLAHT